MLVGDKDEVLDGGGLFEEFSGLGKGQRLFDAGVLNKAELGGGSSGRNDDAAAGVFPIEASEGVATEFELFDRFGDFGFAQRHHGGRGFCGIGGIGGG